MLNKRAQFALAAAAGTIVAVLGPAQSASAAIPTQNADSNCDYRSCPVGHAGQFHLHYNSKENDGYYSGTASFYGNVTNYAGETYGHNGGANPVHYKFVFGKNSAGLNGPGTGQAVKNNAASAENCSPWDSYRVYFNSGYQGSSQYFSHTNGSHLCAGGVHMNLNATLKNNNASQHFA
ncbi:hypothetical protein [Streptomyces uncialis]|uniref:hypothetical protein n=1 Tax=Streptomyces uncialis TaxID=1048205 RepID=UPI00386EEBAA|nr:hypothetical protein OG268_16890 [Streptomyces uncialis]